MASPWQDLTGLNKSMNHKDLWASPRNRLIHTYLLLVKWFQPAYTLTGRCWDIPAGQSVPDAPWPHLLPSPTEQVVGSCTRQQGAYVKFLVRELVCENGYQVWCVFTQKAVQFENVKWAFKSWADPKLTFCQGKAWHLGGRRPGCSSRPFSTYSFWGTYGWISTLSAIKHTPGIVMHAPKILLLAPGWVILGSTTTSKSCSDDMTSHPC